MIETLFLELTNRCNGDCVMCSHHTRLREPTDMPLSTAEKILEETQPETVNLHFFGEPTLHPELVNVVKYATTTGIKTVLDTNGEYMTVPLFKQLQNAGLNRLIWSFGASTEEVYKQVWRGCHYETVVKNIVDVWNSRGIWKRAPKIIIRMIVTKENRHQKQDVMGMFTWHCDDLKYVDEFHLYGYERTPFKKRTDVPDCQKRDRLNREMVVKANGDVVLCCADLRGEYVFGNIHREHPLDIWNGEKYETFRKAIYNGYSHPLICKECTIRPW